MLLLRDLVRDERLGEACMVVVVLDGGEAALAEVDGAAAAAAAGRRAAVDALPRVDAPLSLPRVVVLLRVFT